MEIQSSSEIAWLLTELQANGQYLSRLTRAPNVVAVGETPRQAIAALMDLYRERPDILKDVGDADPRYSPPDGIGPGFSYGFDSGTDIAYGGPSWMVEKSPWAHRIWINCESFLKGDLAMRMWVLDRAVPSTSPAASS